MKWILILISLYGHMPMTTAIFDDETACKNAGRDAKKINAHINFTCAPSRSG